MRIALCDDETDCLNTLKNYIMDFCQKQNISVDIDLFSCGQYLLFADAVSKYDIIFMDIYLQEENGINIIKKLNKTKEQQIVFTTTSLEHAIEAFGLNATHYIVKPVSLDSISQAMGRCLERLGQKALKILDVKTADGIVAVPMEQIQYIEVFNKICAIHAGTNIFETHTSLDALYEQLDPAIFLRPQRSYIVNMNEIDSFLFDRIILKAGIEISLSRSNRAVLKKQYQDFIFNLARRDIL